MLSVILEFNDSGKDFPVVAVVPNKFSLNLVIVGVPEESPTYLRG